MPSYGWKTDQSEERKMNLKGNEIVLASKGKLLQGNPGQLVTGFAIDSRHIVPGDFFIPFKGEHTDGHLYLNDAFTKGAVGAFVEKRADCNPQVDSSFVLIEVDHSLLALQRLSAWYRKQFRLTVIGITGSSGKTTTKDYVAGVLSAKYHVLKTEANLNNEIGLPLTLLKLEQSHQVAVLEMGMSASGEIDRLCRLSGPSVGVITNIGEAHLELLGSIEAIAKAKGELLDYLGSGGVAVLNGDDPRLLKLGERYPGKVYYYGFNQGDIQGLELSQRGENSFFRVRFPDKSEGWFKSPLPGRESVSDALAALSVGYILGLKIPEMQGGLDMSQTTAGRLQVYHNADGLVVIDDSYNANPSSVKAAVDVLHELGGRNTVAVLGDMLELGFAAEQAHQEVGRYLADSGITYLITVGELMHHAAREALMGGMTVYSYNNIQDAVARLYRLPLNRGWHILIKGSRGMKMDIISSFLLEQNREGAGG
jgi:UDP-N-acetylmuramoyl-tripeptide--D-alanyl-D-alanine ligase